MKVINMKNAMKAYKNYDEATTRRFAIKRSNPHPDRLDEADKAVTEAWREFTEATAALTEAIEEAQKRCTARTIDAFIVCRNLEEVERRLDLPKRALEGISVTVDPNAQDFPKAYKYTPESTVFSAVYKSGSWKITDVTREKTAKLFQGTRVTLTEEAKAEVIARALKEKTVF